MKVLLIVDPQNDFITGSLAVPGATAAMDYLTEWVRVHRAEYDAIVVTLDQHPADHCSFAVQGGPWPVHCVIYTLGAALYPPLGEVLTDAQRAGESVLYVPKAPTQERDAYSAFEEYVPEPLRQATEIDVAGLAGDYCVRSSIADLRRHLPQTRMRTLDEAIAWIGEPTPLL